MACYHPLAGYIGPRNENGKRPIVFRPESDCKGDVLIPCGRCIGCQLERARQWAMRAVHESKCHAENSFVTVTYEDAYLPDKGSLRLRDHTLFMKRLRERVDYPIRFMMCGEYGETTARPHYHYLLFGFYPSDVKLYAESQGNPVYTSKFLDDIWGFGECKVGAVSFESAGYVARYTTKKLSDNKLSQVYDGREPEFFLMSRRPGIGKAWAEKYAWDWYRSDYSIMNGRKVKPPKFYESVVEKWTPEVMSGVKSVRKSSRSQDDIDSEYRRGYVRETVKNAAITTLGRKTI